MTSLPVSGFTSFNATVPCNKCSTAFPARYNTHLQRDFSFGLEDIDAWSLRTNIENRYHAKNWKEATTKRQRADLEQKYGTRFSALHDLEYLDLEQQRKWLKYGVQPFVTLPMNYT
ncbi:hypothetical protein G6F52_013644 [Rhizopus delemar]|nr:hypothetical protein G6F52_013761 [Rhizopus delemar]KAG1490129.1 hypothetical protein G6F52_013644 [Rhizopus delemar]